MPELLPIEPPLVDSRDVELSARDGYRLAATIYEPRSRRRATVLINSATAVPRRYYRRFARYLAGRGFRVVTYDYRGIGGSRPRDLRGFTARLSDWGKLDLPGVIDALQELMRADEKLYVVGHSVGGQLVGLAPNNDRIDGFVAVGAQFGDYRLWPLPAQAKQLVLWKAVLPLTTATFGFLPKSVLGQPLPRGVAEEWAHWCLTPGYLLGAESSHQDGFDRVRVPLLALTIADDDYAPPTAVDALVRAYRNARVWQHTIRPADYRVSRIGHFGLFREKFAQTLWRSIAQWLEARVDFEAQRAQADLPAAA